MTAHTWWLLLILTVAIAALIYLINSRLRVHPFVALILVSVGTGIAAGEPAAKLAGSIEEGAGGTLGDVGVTLALGAMLGRLLSDSGATDAIARALVARAEPRRLPWLVGAAAFVIGVPMFFEVGLIVLLPLIFSVARRMEEHGGTKGSPYVLLGVPAIASLSTLHGMLPPHPGPLTAMTGLHADLGLTLGVGIVCAVPTVILAGPVYARWIAPRLPDVAPDAELVAQFTGAEPQPAEARTSAPGAQASAEVPRRTGVPTGLAVAAVLVPVVLMLLRTLAETVLDESSGLGAALVFAGEPLVAMLAGFVFALGVTMVGSARAGRSGGSGRSGEETRASLTDSLKSIAAILLIIGGGGAFKQVLQDSGIGDAIASAAEGAHINVILLGWLIALLLSLTTGSATVGIVSATGIVAPLIGDGGGLEASLLVVAIGAGSLGLNYVNHAGFWLVKESFGMDLTQATKTQTAVQTLVSVLGLAMALLLSVFA
ncbi:GntP family permease [Streptomyces rapamycinicus]|uniref:Gluconate transporter n=2 Tax=Streptomyces rapamycinicus TaxID=1226757 RepID=A0A0A0N485_STRRN|nr:gluconate:H+ symporter [Streptomyces rapamycinicus]AGP53352.1 gluconate transporter [Streptomyces rapamycinicus NRRL 5491]MBB4780838.1 GntP family gluconate:H+ symporter [Streptomyces rapamycinicus]RLV74514.1 gluconate transporter [Streptomyces rapamycinicus NRRL 5491]UTO61528.1 GntP family permease [Streptomyces rapamycinicus]UTP29475.1 GntP family permease [Streptomyces rapamycinicus NRRL 5491]